MIKGQSDVLLKYCLGQAHDTKRETKILCKEKAPVADDSIFL